MTDLIPVDQVAAVKDRQSRKIFKGRGDQIIIFANPANGRIGVTTREDRIVKGFFHSKELSLDRSRSESRYDLPFGKKIEDDGG